MKRTRVITAGIAGLVLLGAGWQRGRLFSQAGGESPAEFDPSVRTVRVRFGINDQAPQKWDGKATVIGGTILRIRNWHPRPGDSVDQSGLCLRKAGTMGEGAGRFVQGYRAES